MEEQENTGPEYANYGGQTTSDLYKIVRAVDGDTTFKLRAEMALEIEGKPKVRKNLIHIAKSVVDYIDCTIEGTVNTEKVTDEMIVTAIETVPVDHVEAPETIIPDPDPDPAN